MNFLEKSFELSDKLSVFCFINAILRILRRARFFYKGNSANTNRTQNRAQIHRLMKFCMKLYTN